MPTPPLPPELQDLLAKPNPAVIGTVAPDGSPNTVATWYLWEDGRILVNIDEERRRLEYLRSNPRVSLTVLDGEEWYRHVSLRGRGDLRDGAPRAPPRALRAARVVHAPAWGAKRLFHFRS